MPGILAVKEGVLHGGPWSPQDTIALVVIVIVIAIVMVFRRH